MFAKFKSISVVAMAAMLSLTLAGCSTTQSGMNDSAASDEEVYDPIEGLNRATFAFNEMADDVLLEHLARIYRGVTPQPVRTGVTNFLRNLKSPVNIANQLLQGDLSGAGNDVVRFGVNTTVGVAGLIDVAAMQGFPYEQEDFGQTLGKWGLGHGVYLVLPFMGPSSLRDGAGMMVDSYADPLRIYFDNTDRKGWHYGRIALTALDTRTQLLDVLDDLQKNSFDYYAALRSTYAQRREALVNDLDPTQAVAPAIPDFEDE